MDLWTLWSQSSSCSAFFIVPNSIRDHHTKFEIDWRILTCIKLFNVKNVCENESLMPMD